LQEEGSSEKEIALKKIYKMNAIDLKKFWLAKIFREEISSFPQTLASNEAVKQFVSHVPNAISLINAAFVDESLKVLRINGKSFGEKGYALSEK
jgi:ABC-type phosphate transport system substrate-binding protein